MQGADNTWLEYGLPVFIGKQTGTFLHNDNSIFFLKPDLSTPLQPVTESDGIKFAAPSLTVSIKAQAADPLCQTIARELEQSRTDTNINKKRVFAQRAHTDEALKKLVPQPLRQGMLSLLPYPSLFAHLEQRRLYDTMQRDCFYPNMALDVNDTVRSCESCAKNSSDAKHKRHLHLFSATGPLKLVAMDILDPPFKKTEEN